MLGGCQQMSQDIGCHTGNVEIIEHKRITRTALKSGAIKVLQEAFRSK